MAVATPPAAPTRVASLSRPRRRGRGLGLLGTVCAIVISVAVAAAVLGPVIAPHPPNAIDLGQSYIGPTAGHPLGFDGQGRDLLSRLIVGARTAMLGPLVVVALSTVVGVALALVAAWRGGWADTVLSAAMDILFAFPGILLAVLAAAVFGPSLIAAALSLAIAYTPYVMRVVRSAALKQRAQPYVAALEVQGLTVRAICVRHLLRNLSELVIAEATILFGWAMLDLAAISFLGLGVQPPQADWGVMVSEGETGVLQGYPAEALSAGIAIVVVVVAFNLLGERLSDRSSARGG
jgi:peptide/nickel transport system permease protein